jgi:hypothetical protein
LAEFMLATAQIAMTLRRNVVLPDQAALLGSLPFAAAAAAFAPPFETPTSAGRSTRSPIV